MGIEPKPVPASHTGPDTTISRMPPGLPEWLRFTRHEVEGVYEMHGVGFRCVSTRPTIFIRTSNKDTE
jgi:hypothetical protein